MVTSVQDRMRGPQGPADETLSNPTGQATEEELASRPVQDPPLFEAVQADWGKLVLAVRHYLGVRRDLARSKAQVLVWHLIGAGMAMVLLVSALATAAVLVLMGATHGLTELLGGRLWAAELIVGLAVVTLVVLVTGSNLQRLRGRWHQETMAKYEHRERHS